MSCRSTVVLISLMKKKSSKRFFSLLRILFLPSLPSQLFEDQSGWGYSLSCNLRGEHWGHWQIPQIGKPEEKSKQENVTNYRLFIPLFIQINFWECKTSRTPHATLFITLKKKQHFLQLIRQVNFPHFSFESNCSFQICAILKSCVTYLSYNKGSFLITMIFMVPWKQYRTRQLWSLQTFC